MVVSVEMTGGGGACETRIPRLFGAQVLLGSLRGIVGHRYLSRVWEADGGLPPQIESLGAPGVAEGWDMVVGCGIWPSEEGGW